MIASLLLLALEPPPAALTFDQRIAQTIEFHAKPAKLDQAGYATIAAKLKRREDADWCSRRLLEILNEGPSGDMFWMFPVTAIAYLDQGQLSPAARAKLKASWKDYMPYRGDTENHWLLYYTSMYLMNQLWPDESGAGWFTGKSSAENRKEAEAWIRSWVRLTSTRGQGEYDCTHYIGVYLLPLSYLAAWAKDPEMRKLGESMIEYVLADYAIENLNGIYVGSHARTDDRQVLEKWNGVSSDFGWMLFGLGYHTEPAPAAYALFYALASAYQPPAILQRIATAREKPYTHYERKRTRNRWRGHDERHGPVYKTTYMQKEYAVSSDQGGILQPIQQHSWDITWAEKDPRGKHNTLFTVHPYSSNDELLSYFTFSPDAGTEQVVRSKVTYDSPDKFLGGSPYEQITQDEDALIVLYNIPGETRFPHINGFFSKDLTQLEEHSSGWIFARGGDAWIAYRPLAPYLWKPLAQGGKRLFSPYLRNGAVVQAAPASQYASMAEFRAAILNLELTYQLEPTPSVRFRNLRGRLMRVVYGEAPDRSAWPLFGGAFLESAVDSRRLTLRHEGETRVIDLSAF
jgi:hypothetical protein